MKKKYLFLLSLFSIILLFLFVFYNRYSNDVKEQQINEIISKKIDILYENISFEKMYAQSLAIMLSKDNIIIDSLHNFNQKKTLLRLLEFLNELKTTTGVDYIDIQVHTKDLEAFARTWDKGNYLGEKLDIFRKGLVKVKKQQKSFVSIEIGKRLNIKAISPIYYEDKYIGSIEVISSFKGIKKYLKRFDLSMLGLLDKKYLNIASDLKNNPKINNYVIIEKNFDKTLFNILKNNNYIFKEKKFFYNINNKIIVFLPMKNIGINDIGLIILMIKNVKLKQNLSQKNYEIENNNYQFNQTTREVSIK